jgi:hypothetical protein
MGAYAGAISFLWRVLFLSESVPAAWALLLLHILLARSIKEEQIICSDAGVRYIRIISITMSGFGHLSALVERHWSNKLIITCTSKLFTLLCSEMILCLKRVYDSTRVNAVLRFEGSTVVGYGNYSPKKIYPKTAQIHSTKVTEHSLLSWQHATTAAAFCHFHFSIT